MQATQNYTLYTYFRSSTSWRVRIVLNYKQLPHSFKFVHLVKGEQKDTNYKQINPNAAVPTLVVSEGQVLIESVAICEYLEQKHGQKSLFPKDAIKKAQIRGFCQVINSGLHPYQNLRLLQKINSEFNADKIKWAKEWVIHGMCLLEKMLQKTRGKYCFGDEITMADVFFVPHVQGGSTRFSVSLNDYPIIQQILTNLQSLQAFQQAQPKNQPDFEK